MKNCSVFDCENPANSARGFCHKHYKRWKTTGDPNKVIRISGPMPIRERFHLQCRTHKQTGCWIWVGHIGSRGYGRIKVNRKTKSAHRVSYELFVGEIPDGMFVCHSCDTPACVNPDHLFLGTPKENSADMMRKWRDLQRIGEHCSTAKLTTEQAKAISASSVPVKEIAKEFGLSLSAVYRIRSGKTWSRAINANQRRGNV